MTTNNIPGETFTDDFDPEFLAQFRNPPDPPAVVAEPERAVGGELTEDVPTKASDELDELDDTPTLTFDDVRFIFRKGLPVVEYQHPVFGRVLLAGYAQDRLPDTPEVLVNCVVNKERFFAAPSLAELEWNDEHHRRVVKVFPWREGLQLRYWVAIGRKDRDDLHHSATITASGLVIRRGKR